MNRWRQHKEKMRQENFCRAESEVQAESWCLQDIFPVTASTYWPLSVCQATFILTQKTLNHSMKLEFSRVLAEGRWGCVLSKATQLVNHMASIRQHSRRHPPCPPCDRDEPGLQQAGPRVKPSSETKGYTHISRIRNVGSAIDSYHLFCQELSLVP